MRELPSGYTAVIGLGSDMGYRTDGVYVDTGVVPTSTMKVTALFYTFANAYEWVFGARNTNSTSSAGQLNFMNGGGDSGTGTSYIGYHNTRISVGDIDMGLFLFVKDGNEFSLNDEVRVIEKTGATNTFTGNKNIYLLAVNNGGTPSYGTYLSARMYAFKIEDNGVVVRDYAPVYKDSTGEYGMYDFANSTFTAVQGSGSVETYRRLTVTHSDGGQAYVRTYNSGNVSEALLFEAASTGFSKTPTDLVLAGANIFAVPDKGYVFVGWELNGQIQSNFDDCFIKISQDTTVKAIFVKEKKEETKLGYKLLGIEYGTGDTSTGDFARQNYYAEVISANLSIDGTSASTSTIVCKKVPSEFINNIPVFLLNPRGKVVYCGIIKSINDNTITCREPTSIFDSDFMLVAETSSYKVLYFLYQQMFDFWRGHTDSQARGTDEAVYKMMLPFRIDFDRRVPYDITKALNITAPAVTETKVINLQSFIFDAFNDFGIVVDSFLDWVYYADRDYDNGQGKKYLMFMTVTNPKMFDTISLGDNLECLTNISVDVEEQETTVLDIYNSSGSSYRGTYSVKNDGTITELVYPIDDYISSLNCKPKVVMSDDKLNVLLEQYLSNAKYNHKIEFDIDLNNSLLSLDAFKIGRRVDFYYKDKVYNSIVTGISFNVLENTDEIQSAKVILGKVRNKLTIKLNLQKSKKK